MDILAQSALSRVQSLPPSSMIVNGEEINCSPPLKSARQASRSGLNLLRALDPTPHTTARFLIREMQNQEVSVAAAACQSELDVSCVLLWFWPFGVLLSSNSEN